MMNPMQLLQFFTGPNGVFTMPVQLKNEYQKFISNPAAYMASANLNIPQQYMQSPETAGRYLLQNSNMSQNDINQVMQAASKIQRNAALFQGNGSGNFPG